MSEHAELSPAPAAASLPAGPELNALIQAEVYGATPLTDAEWELFQVAWLMQSPYEPQNRPVKIPREHFQLPAIPYCLDWPRDYSRNQSTAMDLVDEMRRDGWLFDICDFETTDDRVIKSAGFQKLAIRAEATADTDALAISLAALFAIREWKNFCSLAIEETGKELANT